MTFAEKLASEKSRLNLTLPQLAAALDVSERAISGWLSGRPPIALTQEGALARLAALGNPALPLSDPQFERLVEEVRARLKK